MENRNETKCIVIVPFARYFFLWSRCCISKIIEKVKLLTPSKRYWEYQAMVRTFCCFAGAYALCCVRSFQNCPDIAD